MDEKTVIHYVTIPRTLGLYVAMPFILAMGILGGCREATMGKRRPAMSTSYLTPAAVMYSGDTMSPAAWRTNPRHTILLRVNPNLGTDHATWHLCYCDTLSSYQAPVLLQYTQQLPRTCGTATHAELRLANYYYYYYCMFYNIYRDAYVYLLRGKK